MLDFYPIKLEKNFSKLEKLFLLGLKSLFPVKYLKFCSGLCYALITLFIF